jgi:hypothetical protein
VIYSFHPPEIVYALVGVFDTAKVDFFAKIMWILPLFNADIERL